MTPTGRRVRWRGVSNNKRQLPHIIVFFVIKVLINFRSVTTTPSDLPGDNILAATTKKSADFKTRRSTEETGGRRQKIAVRLLNELLNNEKLETELLNERNRATNT